MEYLFIILFIYASYLSIEKYVHTGSIFTWRGRKDKKERRTAPAAIHPAIAPSQAGIIGKSRYQMRHSLTIDDNSGQPESGIERVIPLLPKRKQSRFSEYTNPLIRIRNSRKFRLFFKN